MNITVIFLVSCLVILAGGGSAGALLKNKAKNDKPPVEKSAETEDNKKEASKEKKEKKEKEPKQRDIAVSNGKIALDISAKDGSTGIFVFDEKGKKRGLLSYSDGYASSYFVLRAGRNQHFLRGSRSGRAQSSIQETEYGAQVFYDIENTAQVAIDYTFVEDEATVYVTAFITNTGKTKQVYALKAIYDTFLGESSKANAFNFLGQAINSRHKISTVQNGDWIISANRTLSMAFVALDSMSLNAVEALTIGTPDDFSSRKWIPEITEGKLFSSVHSFNDSALALNWKKSILAPNETSVQSFVISAGIKGEKPAFIESAEKLRAEQQSLNNSNSQIEQEEEIDEEDIVEVIVEDSEGDVQTSENETQLSVNDDTENKEIEISDWQLDPVYIQSLLDRISELQADGSVDQSEIRQLSEELDAIFLKLRQKKQ